MHRYSKGLAAGRIFVIAAATALACYGALQCKTCMRMGSASRLTCRIVGDETVENNKTNLCLTPACVHAASEILYNLSPQYKQLDACDNFEELVCGGWRDRHDLRADQGDAFTGTIMSEKSQMLLRHILEEPYPRDSDVSFQSSEMAYIYLNM